jgi:hypothetical protein
MFNGTFARTQRWRLLGFDNLMPLLKEQSRAGSIQKRLSTVTESSSGGRHYYNAKQLQTSRNVLTTNEVDGH